MGRNQTIPAEAVAEAHAEPTIAKRLEVIEEQGRQTVELLRTLLSLLMPSEERDGPSLEDLVAAMIAMQRDLLSITRGTRSDLKKLGETLPSAVVDALSASVPSARVLRS